MLSWLNVNSPELSICLPGSPPTRAIVSGTADLPAGQRSRIDLNGDWERYVDGRLFDLVHVPASRRPLGYYRLKRAFLLPKLSPSQRAILHLDAITYHGRVFVNGVELGTMGPYVPYEFDFTGRAREGNNQLEVAISDLIPDPSGAGKDEIELGVNPGWEGYGGIIRDVYVEVRPAVFIGNIRLGYGLSANYTTASCEAELHLSSSVETPGELNVLLYQGNTAVAKAIRTVAISKGDTNQTVSFELNVPLLWSPEEPNLYLLVAQVRTEHGLDQFTCRTGFRHVAVHGRNFELNGRRLILSGVCRHDMWKDQGFTLSREQMEQDMRMIKGLGCNFVRLVHYPHHRHIVELADELGLLVTEEPGYWNMDFRKMRRSMIEVGLQVMERAIRRDWNSPSVFAWLLGNECTLTVDYLREGKALCRRLDPIARLVSFANSMGDEESKTIFEQADMDFFDQHAYGFDENKFSKTAEIFGDSRPTTFTEWGWEVVGADEIVYDRDFDRLLDLVEAGKVAGHAFWSWQDMRQYGRIDWPTQNGILLSGVVTEGRELRPKLYLELARLFQRRRHEEVSASTQPRNVPLRWAPWSSKSRFQTVDLQPVADSDLAQRAWTDLEFTLSTFWSKSRLADDQWKRTGEKFQLWQNKSVAISGANFKFPVINGFARPLVLTPRFPDLVIPVKAAGTQLHFLGQVTVPSGYPANGRLGQMAGSYRINYAAGKVMEIPLRQGLEVTQGNLVHEATRIHPLPTSSQPALEFVKDVAREHYQVLLFSVPIETVEVESIACRLIGDHPLLIFAVTLELA